VRDRAEIRKRQEEEQYEEALRQARITANAERRLAAERALARMSEIESEEKPLGHTVQVAIPTRNHPPHPGLAVGAGKGAGRRAKSQNPFGATWNDSIGGGGWSMLSSNLIDDQPPPATKGSARSRSHCGNTDERVVADSPQNLQHAMRERQQQAKRRDEELYEASLLRARQEAAAERKRLAEQQQHHACEGGGTRHKAFRDEPEEFKNSFLFESFQKSRAASAGSTDTNNKASSKASSKDSRSGLIFVQLEPPRREKPHLSSQRRCSSVQGEGDEGKQSERASERETETETETETERQRGRETERHRDR